MATGKFITFEGPEGGGKSTHIQKLAIFLGSQGIDVITTREPGGTALGEKIRALIQHSAEGTAPVDRAELLLFLASRAQHVQELIQPMLRAGRWVLCDRFCDSTLAYQGFGRGFDIQQLQLLNDFAANHLVPDLTLLLDISPATSRQRLARRHREGVSAPDRIEAESHDFHVRLRNGFLTLAQQEKARFQVVNAEREQSLVEREICEIIKQRFFSLSSSPTPNPQPLQLPNPYAN
ncbi:MAG: dTMP kinase [Kiritimatiellae bacterium]|nr:dTMP kinase [Kiritimatiellia bacterium]